MAVETYTRKPRGQKHPIVKYRVRIRTTVESTHDPDERIPVNIDELYDTLAEAKRAEDRHWLSIRTGTLSVELSNQVKRLAEPAMRDLLETYHARTKQYRSASIQVKNAFDIGDLEHLVKRFYKDKAAESAAKALREGRSLTLEELAAIGGHADKGMVARYANLTPEDLARGDERKTVTGDPGKIVVKQDGAEFVAIIGNVEARAVSAKAAMQMARELAEVMTG